MHADDRQFVISGWSASYRMSRDVSFVQMRDYADYMHPVIQSVLARPATEVLVAEGHVLQGFLAFERPDYVLFVYVPQPFRGNGLARSLFEAAGIDPSSRFEYACRTRASWECKDKIPNAQYNPMRARFEPKENHVERRDTRY